MCLRLSCGSQEKKIISICSINLHGKCLLRGTSSSCEYRGLLFVLKGLIMIYVSHVLLLFNQGYASANLARCLSIYILYLQYMADVLRYNKRRMLKRNVFCDVTSCVLVNICWSFREIWIVSFQGWRALSQFCLKNGDNIFIRNVGKCIPDYTASHPRRQWTW